MLFLATKYWVIYYVNELNLCRFKKKKLQILFWVFRLTKVVICVHCYILKLNVIVRVFGIFFFYFFRRRGQESSKSHTHRNCGVLACLLHGLFWGFSCTDSYDAILYTRREKSSASSICICWMGSCKICCSSGIPLCFVHKVKTSIC